MKRFETPMMEIQRLSTEDIFTNSCTVEALGCTSCYCVAVTCDDYTCSSHQCSCDNDID
jgi:hypothetical protein